MDIASENLRPQSFRIGSFVNPLNAAEWIIVKVKNKITYIT